MSFFRFCRQGLTALPVFLLFSACDKLLPTGGSGELVPVKIRSVSVKGYGDASVTRSAGGEKRIVQEPVIQNLDGGVLASITVEEDVEALRTGETADLEKEKQYRVIVLKNSDKTYVTHGDFTVGNGNAGVDLEEGAYDFICISYNNKTDLPPDEDYKEGQALPALAVDLSHDLLYDGTSNLNVTVSDDGTTSLSFTLKHQLATVQLTLDTRYNDWPISAINNSNLPGIETVATSATFGLASGQFGDINTGNLSFTGFSATASTTFVSNWIRVVPQTKSISLSLPAGMVQASNLQISLPVAQRTIDSTVSPEEGYSYAFRLKIYLPKFASSNVYWEDDGAGYGNGGRLTFAPYSDTPGSTYATEQNYQGVMFKYGALEGIAPQYTGYNTFNVESVPLFVYNGQWVQTTAQTMGYSHYNDIVYYAGNKGSAREIIDLPAGNWISTRLGDICQLISTVQDEYNDNDKPLYRLPMAAECGAGAGVWTFSGGNDITSTVGTSWATLYGKFDAGSGGRAVFAPTGLVFPAGGYYMGGGAVSMAGVGFVGNYFTGGNDYPLLYHMPGSSVLRLYSYSAISASLPTVAQPIRCMVNPD